MLFLQQISDFLCKINKLNTMNVGDKPIKVFMINRFCALKFSLQNYSASFAWSFPTDSTINKFNFIVSSCFLKSNDL